MIASFEATGTLPEDQLLARCRSGDLDAFAQVYARYESVVYQHAYHLLGHREDAHDVRQETFLRAYQAIARFRGECSLKTWLLKICSNQCRNRLRSPQRRREVPYDPIQAEDYLQDTVGSEDPGALAERAQMAQIIRSALRGLPPGPRELIVLRDVEDLEPEEIANILGCSRLSVPVKLFRARRLLKERVKALLDRGEHDHVS